MIGFWTFYFGWYQGAVYSNLLASAICSSLAAGLVLWRAGKRMRAQHEALQQQLSVQHEEHLELHARTHELLRGRDGSGS